MTQSQLHQYTVSKEILHLARQLNLQSASPQANPEAIRALAERIRLLCEELKKS